MRHCVRFHTITAKSNSDQRVHISRENMEEVIINWIWIWIYIIFFL